MANTSETARRRDVLEVHPAEDGSDRGHDVDDLVRVVRVVADREGVDPAELLEEDGLAFHHGQRSRWTHVAESEHRGAIAHDGHRVLLDRQRPRLFGIVGDRPRDAGDAGRVRHRQVVARLQRLLGDHLELAAEMQEERSIRDVLDLDAGHLADRGNDALEVLRAGGQHCDVADLLVVLDPDEVDRVQKPAGDGDRLRELCKRAGTVREVNAQGRAELRGRVSSGRLADCDRHEPSVGLALRASIGVGPQQSLRQSRSV
jgi:hypothetical protein